MKQIILLIQALLLEQVLSEIQCLNPHGSPVDWFVALKVPVGVDGKGLEYGYLDSSNTKMQFFPDLNNINQSPLLMTLQPYAKTNQTNYAQILWNDQPTDNYTPAMTFAHAKGIMIFDEKTGFIIIHSLPVFAQIANGSIVLDLNTGSTTYGQHFFCISVSTATINQYSQMLLVDRPYVYTSYVPSQLQTLAPYATQLLKNTNRATNLQDTTVFNSLGGVSFIKFAKSSNLNTSFYTNIVAPYLKEDLVFETWGNGAGGLEGPDCGTYSVVSNLNVTMSPNISYLYTQDHSKYGISLQNHVCFGDINRMTSQNTRGGGTVCFISTSVHTVLSNIFLKREQCQSNSTNITNLTQESTQINQFLQKYINNLENTEQIFE